MGRFNNLRMSPDPQPAGVIGPEVLAVPDPPAVSATAAAVEEIPTAAQRAGFVLLSLYLLSGYANDLTQRLFHTKAWISTITEVLLPFLLLASGAALYRSLRSREGRIWLFYIAWLVVDLPFSVWRGGTATMLINYSFKNWILFFYVTVFACSRVGIARLMRVQVAASLLLLVSCLAFGSSAGDRFAIADSVFFGNANELAMQVLFGIAALVFVVYTGRLFVKIAAIGAVGLSVLYVLRTGSRGGLVGALALVLTIVLLSRRKIMILLISAVLAAVALLFVSPQTLDRLKLAFTEPEPYEATTVEELAAIESRMQREQLLRRSITMAFQNPLFGVGPDQFPVAVHGEEEKKGKRSNWLGTHNSYTQVASECGFPAFFAYCATLIYAIRTSLRIFAATRGDPAYRDLEALSASLIAALVVYAVCTFFDHIAYTGILPLLAGLALSLKSVATRIDPLAARIAGRV